MNTVWVEKKDLDLISKEILSKTFPRYSGRKFRISYADSIQFNDTQWSGGTRSEYAVVQAMRSDDNLLVLRIPTAPFMQMSKLHDNAIPLTGGYVVVEHSIFCGKDMGITFHVSTQSNIFLPPTQTNLTRNQEIVLVFTRSYKSSYGGVKNLRFYEANRKYGITENDWNEAKQSLIAMGYLTKAGAITASGRNVVGSSSITF